MGKTKKKTTTRNADKTTFLVEKIVEGMQEKKASGIVLMDLTKLSSRVCDYFVICNADNTRQVAAIADSVEDFTTRFCEEKPWHVEGIQNAQWILMDYVNVVVHVFQTETRDFYGIENLWADADVKRIED